MLTYDPLCQSLRDQIMQAQKHAEENHAWDNSRP